MNLIEITDKDRLNNFVGAQPHAEFLQSWEWGGLQKKSEGPVLSNAEGEIKRFGVEENGEIIAVATLVKKSLPMGMNYFYCPRGPILNYELRITPSTSSGQANYELLNFLFSEIQKIAQKEKVIFLRFEPSAFSLDSKTQLPAASYQSQVKKTIDIQPSETVVLDLSKSEEELMSAMHQKTRYNIRLAEKKDVKIEEIKITPPYEGGDRGGFENFWQMMAKTAQRDKFTAHDKNYYEKILQIAPEKFKLFVATYQEKIIAAGVFSFFGDTATYIFGASSDEDRNVMAPYLLQWELIKRAKSSGCKYYDFFGIDEKKWPGVTRFKRGFAGVEIKYPGTFDVIFSNTQYRTYNLLRKVRRLFR